MSERVIRKGSIWKHRDTGDEVEIVFGRQRFCAFVRCRDPKLGGVDWQEDFRKRYEWVRGRA